MPPENCVLRTFLVATSKRDKVRYPNPSDFTYDLPIPLHNVVGIAIRDFKFGDEQLVNENNKVLSLSEGGSSASVVLSTGNYNNNITDLFSELNSKMSTYKTSFSIDASTGRAKISYTGNSYIIIQANTLLRFLGFPDGKDVGVCIYKPGHNPTNLTYSVVRSASSIVAPQSYNMYHLSEMVVRITDVETIMSNDAVTNRSSAVLFSSNSPSYTAKQCLDHFIPLLQKQSRLQSLKIKLLNMEGDLYDTINNEAVLLLEFYCQGSNL